MFYHHCFTSVSVFYHHSYNIMWSHFMLHHYCLLLSWLLKLYERTLRCLKAPFCVFNQYCVRGIVGIIFTSANAYSNNWTCINTTVLLLPLGCLTFKTNTKSVIVNLITHQIGIWLATALLITFLMFHNVFKIHFQDQDQYWRPEIAKLCRC